MAPRSGRGRPRRSVHAQVRFPRPFAAGFYFPCCCRSGRAGACGGSLLLFRASLGGGQPCEVVDAGNVEFDADGQLVHVDGGRDLADGRQEHARRDRVADVGHQGHREQRDRAGAGDRLYRHLCPGRQARDGHGGHYHRPLPRAAGRVADQHVLHADGRGLAAERQARHAHPDGGARAGRPRPGGRQRPLDHVRLRAGRAAARAGGRHDHGQALDHHRVTQVGGNRHRRVHGADAHQGLPNQLRAARQAEPGWVGSLAPQPRHRHRRNDGHGRHDGDELRQHDPGLHRGAYARVYPHADRAAGRQHARPADATDRRPGERADRQVTHPPRPKARAGLARLGLRLAGAGLLATAGAIHLDLYLTGYRSIPTIGWLFLLQAIAAFGLALAVLATGSRLIAAAGAGFALATLGGYLLSIWVGLFGFKEIRTTAGIVAGIIEVAAFAALAALAATPAATDQQAGQATGGSRLPAWFRGSQLLAGLQAGIPGVGRAVVGLSIAALVVLGISVAQAGGPAPAPASGGQAVLKTATIGGVTVLTSAQGSTLYWFAL